MFTTYFVSPSSGRDSNSGTSRQAPFASFDPVNRRTLEQGDRILLKRGDVFRDMVLRPCGNGTAQAPIVIGAYDDGDAPLFTGSTTNMAAISLSANEGGYVIRDIAIQGYQLGIVCVRPGADALFTGLRIEDCRLTDITTGRGWEPDPGLDEGAALSYGILLENAQDVSVSRVQTNNCDCPLRVRGRRMRIEQVDARDSGVQGFMIYGLGYGEQVLTEEGAITVENCRVHGVGRYGLRFGTTAMMTENINRCVIRDCEIAYVVNHCHNFDSCAMDFENNNVDCLIENVYAHDNDGPFLLAMEHNDDTLSLGVSRGNVVRDCLSVNNARRDSSRDASFLNLSSYFGDHQTITVENCVDIGPQDSYPYSYDNYGQVTYDTGLPADKVAATGFVSGVMDVEDAFYTGDLRQFDVTEGVRAEKGRLRLPKWGCLRTRFSGRDYTVSLYMKGDASLWLLSPTPGEGYVWTFAAGRIIAARRCAGVSETLAVYAVEGLEPGDWKRLRVSCAQGRLSTYVDDRFIGCLTDNTFTQGAAALQATGEAMAAELFLYRLADGPRAVRTLFPPEDAVAPGGRLAFAGEGFFCEETAWERGPGIALCQYTPRDTAFIRLAGPGAYLEKKEMLVQTDGYPYLLFCLSNDTRADMVLIQYQTAGGVWHDRAVPLRTKPRDAYPFYLLDHKWETYAVDMSTDPAWSGTLTGLRLCFTAQEGYVTVSDVYIASRV